MTGIEPALSAWEAEVLPLNYIRETARGRSVRPRHREPPVQHSGSRAGAGAGAAVRGQTVTSTRTVAPAGAYGTVLPSTGEPSTTSRPRAPAAPEFVTVIS